MMKIWLLTLASTGFGSAVTIALTKPPVIVTLLVKLGALIR